MSAWILYEWMDAGDNRGGKKENEIGAHLRASRGLPSAGAAATGLRAMRRGRSRVETSMNVRAIAFDGVWLSSWWRLLRMGLL